MVLMFFLTLFFCLIKGSEDPLSVPFVVKFDYCAVFYYRMPDDETPILATNPHYVYEQTENWLSPCQVLIPKDLSFSTFIDTKPGHLSGLINRATLQTNKPRQYIDELVGSIVKSLNEEMNLLRDQLWELIFKSKDLDFNPKHFDRIYNECVRILSDVIGAEFLDGCIGCFFREKVEEFMLPMVTVFFPANQNQDTDHGKVFLEDSIEVEFKQSPPSNKKISTFNRNPIHPYVKKVSTIPNMIRKVLDRDERVRNPYGLGEDIILIFKEHYDNGRENLYPNALLRSLDPDANVLYWEGRMMTEHADLPFMGWMVAVMRKNKNSGRLEKVKLIPVPYKMISKHAGCLSPIQMKNEVMASLGLFLPFQAFNFRTEDRLEKFIFTNTISSGKLGDFLVWTITGQSLIDVYSLARFIYKCYYFDRKTVLEMMIALRQGFSYPKQEPLGVDVVKSVSPVIQKLQDVLHVMQFKHSTRGTLDV